MQNNCFSPASILLPDFGKVDGTKWAVIACDQFTSEPAYWESAKKIAGDCPSALSLVLPEVYLGETEARLPKIHAAMDAYLENVLVPHDDAMIYVERTQSDGTVRRGIVGKIDLEAYDYKKGAETLVRATEGTVLSRIPPRVAIRRGAAIELPHVMLLIDDREKTVIEPLCGKIAELSVAYDFSLMLGGGHIRGFYLNDGEKARVSEALSALATPEATVARYGAAVAPLLFAVGDGNHSLASAKAAYEEVKAAIGADAALSHPARYALCEVVNLHDDALSFEPIYRVLFHVDPEDVMRSLRAFAAGLSGSAAPQSVHCVTKDAESDVDIAAPVMQLTVGTLQSFLDAYIAAHPSAEVDYIHDESSLYALARQDDAIGFLFSGMEKDELFRTVIYDGALPRKTFSMGHARDKRYYIEARKIR